MLVLKGELARKLVKDPVWGKRLESCKTMREVQQLIIDYAKEQGIKTKTIKIS